MGDNEEELFPTLVEAPPQPQLELEDDFEDDSVEEEEPLVPEITKREKIKQDDMFVICPLTTVYTFVPSE